jgi:hypothetical protein
MQKYGAILLIYTNFDDALIIFLYKSVYANCYVPSIYVYNVDNLIPLINAITYFIVHNNWRPQLYISL